VTSNTGDHVFEMDVIRHFKFRTGYSFVPVALFLLATALFVAGCGKEETKWKNSQPTFSDSTGFRPGYDSQRQVVKVVERDMNGDGTAEFVVLSMDKSAFENRIFDQQFDLLEIFRYDSLVRAYRSLFADPVDMGIRVTFRDLTGDGREEILAWLSSGGNDPIAGDGLNVYGFTAPDTIRVLFLSETGAPEIADIDEDGKAEILVHDEYWGVMPHSEVIPFVASIHVWDGAVFTPASDMFPDFFSQYIRDAKDDYLRIKIEPFGSESSEDFRLYRAFSTWMIWLLTSGRTAEARQVWEEEKPFLRATLPDDQFDDLESLIESDQIPGTIMDFPA